MKEYYEKYREMYERLYTFKYAIFIMAVILVIDYLNIANKILLSEYKIAIGVLVIIFMILELFKFKGTLRLKIVNQIDFGVVVSLIITLGLAIIYKFILFEISYKLYICLGLAGIFILLLLYRVVVINRATQNCTSESNVYDLKDLYDGKIVCNDSLVFINEEDESYDLLERSSFIKTVYDTIVNCNPKRRFVISLEGPWGCGKTTILNIVKENIQKSEKDIVVIDSFDPWSYNDQTSMFKGMFDILLKESGISYSVIKSKEFIEDTYKILFDTEYTKGLKNFSLFKNNSSNEIDSIKSMISNYLYVTNKRIVFIIDNIDRAEKENIILLFKLVNNVFSFEYVTYVLVFDEARVQKILANEFEIDYDFVKKIIQLQLKVPPIDSSVKKKVISKSFENLVALYGESSIDEYENLLSYLSDIITDVRDLKRFLNSVISIQYRSNRYLNSVDIISLELINLYNNELYNNIKNNRQFYISHDKEYSQESLTYLGLNEKLNKDGKEYFDKLFLKEENKKWLNILSELFPYVKKYSENKDLVYVGNLIYHDKDEYKNIVRNKRICSAKFFDLYFNYGKNEFIQASELVKNIVELSNNNLDIKPLDKEMNLILNNYHRSWHKIIFETLEMYNSDIKNIGIANLIKVLLKNINRIDNSLIFWGLNARTRVLIIIVDLLFKLSDTDFIKSLEDIKNDIGKVSIIDELIYWIENYKNSELEVKSKRKEALVLILEDLIEKIYKENIDIYDSVNYYVGNIRILNKHSESNGRSIKTYVSKILNTKNIIKFLYDLVGVSHDSAYTYYIEKSKLELFTTKEDIDKILAIKQNFTDDEKFVVSIYEKLIDTKSDLRKDDKGITIDEERHIIL